VHYPHTDIGNAERLVAMFGHLFRYCPDWAKWLVWDGARWKPDHSREMQRNAKRTADVLRTGGRHLRQ
jgi:putative DNA primase/helicase